MNTHKDNDNKIDSPACEESMDQWIEKYVDEMQKLFHQWQKPVGIDSRAYRQHLEKELANYWQDPLLKTLIESI
jgi:hypothetical protein